jgi:hypothetical protein
LRSRAGLWKPVDPKIEQIGIEALTYFDDPQTTYTVKQVEDKFGGAYYRNDIADALKYLAEKGELVWTRKGNLGGSYIYQKA